jgi:hypothetical protein
MPFENTLKKLKISGLKISKPGKPSGATIVRILVWTLVVMIIMSGLLYVQATRIPDNYHPARLTQEETKQTVGDFARDIAQGFGNNVKKVEEFDWSIDQSTVNRYLASIDEIAFKLPNGVKRGYIDEEMARLGLADPAVAFEDGKVTLMVRSTKYRKVLSAEISVKLVDEKLKFALTSTRIGKLPVPSSFLTDKIKSLSEKLTGERADDISETLAELLRAIDGEPISPSDAWRIQGIKVAIESLTVDNGKLKLFVRPIPPKRK